MSHLARLLALATLSSSLAGCGGVGLVGNGKSATQLRGAAPFKKLEISGGLHVTLTRGERTLTVTADENLIDHLDTSVRDGTLVIRLTQPVLDARSLKIAIRSNDILEAISLSGGSGFVGPAGASARLDLEASGGSSLEVSELSSAIVNANASGASHLTLVGGAAANLAVSASGASEVTAHGFTVEAAIIEVSGASNVCLTCTRSITGSVSGASTLTVSGSPAIAQVHSSGGSRLIKAN